MGDAPVLRHFHDDGVDWVAWRSGEGALGTGAWGLGRVEAVHFAHADAPDRPLREVLIARGRFDDLFDAELAELLRRGTPIVQRDSRHS
jgi:hypothetical protein